MQNIGTLISASIRPNDSLDPIASAYAVEIKGGLHTTDTSINRDAIIFERREWGMMCYVESDDLTYQLRYNYSSTNIMDNNNWVVFSGSGGGGGEWIDSVLSVEYNEPVSPNNGDRYLAGLAPGDLITGTNWSLLQPGIVVEWNSVTNNWTQTTPTDGMSVRVDNEDNAIYRYEGNFPTGIWGKEKLNQVRSLDATSSDSGFTYQAQSLPTFEAYYENMIFLVEFSTQNSLGTASLNINSLGDINIVKVSSNGLLPLVPNDILPGIIYTLLYDGTDFQLTKPSNEDLFNIKYYVEPTDYIVVPPNHQYWVYGDLTIDGGFVLNQGQIIIANGNLNLINSGNIQNVGTFPNGQLLFANFAGGITPSFVDSNTIQFTQSNSPGLVVSADVIDGSLTASKLNTNGQGATAGYILSVNSDGTFVWIEESVTGATNGLTNYSGEVGLGGELIVDTIIEGNGNQFIIDDLSNFEIQSSTISLISNDFNLLVDSAILNISNGEGLVYATDYSGTFVTNSLITKKYVDDSLSTLINGITVSGPSAGLGGSLYRDTTINGSGYDFILGDLGIIQFTSSIFDIEGYGIISLDAVTGSVQILAEDSVTIASSNTGIASSGNLNLSFVTGSVTSINGEGLVYTQDYSGTFVTNSLVSKLYVDNSLSSLINGITVSGPTAGLGGSLYRDTTINGSGYDFTLGDIGVILFTSSIFDVETEGIISLDGQSMQILADDTITLSSFDTIDVVSNNLNFVFSTGSVTDSSGNGLGLVYSSDYTGTFVTNSLITKQYVDNAVQLINDDFITAIEVGAGLTVSSATAGTASISILDTTAGNGLTFSNGVYDVNTGLGLTISGDDVDMVWGGTSTGLTFSNNAISANVDGTTIIVNGSGQLQVVAGSAQPVYITTTGITATAGQPLVNLLLTPNNYSRIEVYVNGLKVTAGGDVGNLPSWTNQSVQFTGTASTWESTLYDIEATDLIEIIYES